MKYTHTLGIDVSKKTLDCCLLANSNKIFNIQIANTSKGLKELHKRLKKQGVLPANLLVCLEKTGLYSHLLLAFMQGKGHKLWVESSLAIKKSMGLVRGKNDQIDALRIALYSYRHQDQCRLYSMPSKAISALKAFTSMRARLLTSLHQLQTPLLESKSVLATKELKVLSGVCSGAIKALKKDLEKVDAQIQLTIQGDDKLANLFEKVTSVEGVGKVTAAHLIGVTNGFSQITTAKKMACYSGVAPFSYSSGSSVRGKNRISPLANKQMKTVFHMAALTATRTSGDLAAYYKRKVGEGKNKMLVLNAVRNKIIMRIYACVRDNRNYEKNYVRKVA